jgi:hypothetical protein
MAASKFFNGVDLRNQKGINVADPSTGTDAANKQYVDNIAAGLSWKTSVRVATTSDGDLTTSYTDGQFIDGVSLTTGDRILIKTQANNVENGIYTVNATGAPTRSVDADTPAELKGATVLITSGTIGTNEAFTQTSVNITIGVTSIEWVRFGAGQTYSTGNGLISSANVFSVLAEDSSITVSELGIKTTRQQIGATGKYAINIGTLTGGTPVTVTHGLNSLDVLIMCRLIDTGELVDLNATVTGINTVTVVAAETQASGTFRVSVVG